MDVYVESDLVDLVKPGDRVNIAAIYLAMAAGEGGMGGVCALCLSSAAIFLAMTVKGEYEGAYE